jgi:hypothetical protein
MTITCPNCSRHVRVELEETVSIARTISRQIEVPRRRWRVIDDPDHEVGTEQVVGQYEPEAFVKRCRVVAPRATQSFPDRC